MCQRIEINVNVFSATIPRPSHSKQKGNERNGKWEKPPTNPTNYLMVDVQVNRWQLLFEYSYEMRERTCEINRRTKQQQQQKTVVQLTKTNNKYDILWADSKIDFRGLNIEFCLECDAQII